MSDMNTLRFEDKQQHTSTPHTDTVGQAIQGESGQPIAHFHLPGLFEFYDFYKVFLPIFTEHREYFYEWADIASIYGAPDCIWGGGRFGEGDAAPKEVAELMHRYGISARLTFSNSLLRKEHLSDKKCNNLCEVFENTHCDENESEDMQRNVNQSRDKYRNGLRSQDMHKDVGEIANMSHNQAGPANGIIVHSELLLDYLRKKYPGFYFVSSTTKVLTNFDELRAELERDEFQYVVPDFRLNRRFDKLNTLPQSVKNKAEFLCNECCDISCTKRRECYENVSRRILGEDCAEHICASPTGNEGYVFSKAMENPAFISVDDIREIYLPNGFSNFKIEGRGLGSALLLEFILYYMVPPKLQLKVREAVYLDSELDLF